jgi:hypothetical protein
VKPETVETEKKEAKKRIASSLLTDSLGNNNLLPAGTKRR